MANTKTTKRKEGHLCPMCSQRFGEESEWEKHVLECGRKRRQKRFECSHCDYATNKKSDMVRHCKTRHGGFAQVDSESDWEQLDPGNLSDVVGEATAAGTSLPSSEVTQRKPTRPTPVHTPKVKSLLSKRSLIPVAPATFQHPMTTVKEHTAPSATVSAASSTDVQDCSVEDSIRSVGVDKGTQTLPTEQMTEATQTEVTKRRRLDRCQETYQKDGKNVVETHEEELWF
ncbi:RE1-silencing transcription factor-like [Saccostrea cucullata]|uniref:RE1-silencing transcription factor-like n=1 Tax=Saccostrea cuccullata TaxID=36930 RepID=UPI002ED025AB